MPASRNTVKPLSANGSATTTRRAEVTRAEYLYGPVERPLSVRALIRVPWLGAVAIFVSTLVALGLVWPHATPYNNYVYLADAILHGHLWVDTPDYIDALSYAGRRYVIEGPLPVLFVLPLAAIWHMDASQTIVSWVLCALATAVAWLLARRLGVPWRSRIVLTLFLLLGTDLFFCGAFGDVWFLAHVSAVAFTLLALYEVTGRKRGWLLMLWAICAVESRFSMLLALPAYLYLLMDGADPAERRRRFSSATAVLIVAAAIWVKYNLLRWGLPYDIGYTAWYHQDSAGEPVGSPFQLKYLPMQLQAFFVLPPLVLRTFPFLAPTQFGLALPFTSPGLVLAFFARRPVHLVLALWAATILTAGPNFLYYVIGFVQFGMRHALDFEPFLFALMCLSARTGLRWWGVLLCSLSVAAGIWGMAFWITFYRHG